MPIKSATVVLSAVGASAPFAIDPELDADLLPGCLCAVSSGGTLTYSIEITGDDVFANGYNPATGNWFPMDGLAALTGSANGTLVGACTGIRAHVTAYTNGTLTFSFCWARR